ncbi:alpha-2-macroglobulin family protein [Mangrovimonas aestuarii]|uniref:alpha-2-macroglobulin family protein n=1 Tax=Mangrovimonas aestuarii TaxID=3018443 RepID=UPI0023793FFF|nr:MG2 domain-containing protein [Mangrovimonas aestuarii]
MRHLLLCFSLFFCISLFSQDDYYEKEWEEVISLEQEGLPKSALTLVEKLSKQAEQDGNTPQQIKALLFKSKYALILEEDAQLNIVNDFKDAIKQQKAPAKNVLENILANLYWQYFQQNRYRFYQRTKTEEKVDENDFRTWDLETLFTETHKYFQNSLNNGLILQHTPVENYKVLLDTVKNSKTYRPTLFDLLAHNALEFYKSTEHSVTKPVYAFEMDNPKYLADAKTFSRLKLESKDSTALELNAIKIYQRLINFHLKDDKPDALVDVDISRLQYVREHLTSSEKDRLYLETLTNSSKEYTSKSVSGLYDFEIARLWNNQANEYHPKTNDTNRWKRKDALQLCNKVISTFPNSDAAKQCTTLKSSILQPSIGITCEAHLPINTNSKLLVQYKNIKQINLFAYPLTFDQVKAFNQIYREDEQRAFIKTLKASKDWNAQLHDENDYQNHTTEILLPPLENGHYLIVAKVNNESNILGLTTTQVTNLALVEQSDTKRQVYQIIDRNTGKSITYTNVIVNYIKDYSSPKISETHKTNEKGEFWIDKSETINRRNIHFEINHKGDKAHFGDYYINRTYRGNGNENKTKYSAFIFTDRSIYRPGQTVYFKAIAIKTKNGKSEVLPNEEIYVDLSDVNGEEIGELELITNEFGSVSGQYILPKNGLTGQYTIEAFSDNIDWSEAYISVEEYKRPKFKTEFNPITDIFRVNDSIEVTGQALAYAGSNISDAQVTYRVHRKVELPRWYYWHRPMYTSEPQEIAYGTTTTNDKGKFTILFKAIPDTDVERANNPIFHYEITAEVTDINGETRTTTTTVNVGYHTLTASISIAEELDKSLKDHKININTQNLNGEFVPANGTIRIYKLQAPDKVLRNRPWAAPDYPGFTESEFKTLFPHEAYQDENNPDYWKKGALVFNGDFNTDISKTMALGKIKNWESGLYIIELESKDRFNQVIKDQARIRLYSNKDKIPADNQLFSISTDKTTYQPKDEVQLSLGTTFDNLAVTIAIEKDHIITKTQTIQLTKEKKTINIPVNKADLGGFTIHYSFAFQNTFESNSITISVPYPKTDLEIETVTFRDKLEPGTDELWQFKIKGPKGEQVSSELLASMYDASLDQFKPHQWQFNPLQKSTYYSYNHRGNGGSFGTKGFRVYNPVNRTSYFTKRYDQWNWFGFSFGNRYFIRQLESQVAGVVIEEDNALNEEVVAVGYGTAPEVQKAEADTTNGYLQGEATGVTIEETTNFSDVQIRKNLEETAFFFPQLQTDKDGNVSFSFTTPEALTQWKLQLLAHTKTLENKVETLETVTQKQLMVIPNAPRFLREGDKIIISSKISNLSEEALSGQAALQLFDALTGNPIDEQLQNSNNIKLFTVDEKGNTQISWSLFIPEGIKAVQYKIMAKAGDFSDGEQNALPVLSNRMIVTETLPMWVKSGETRTFVLDKLKTNTSTTLKNHKLTLEITSNPAWYAVQALPYLMEFPYECNEQTFSRYYSNALASHIANSNPRIKEVFNQWASQDALISNLEKNEELKSLLIQETPWLRDAQSEAEQKKRIGLLFNLNNLNNQLQANLKKLEQNQMNNGAWSWFNGGRPNRFITQHIISGFGHLSKLNVKSSGVETSQMIQKAVAYLDGEFIKEYKDLTKYNKDIDLSQDHLSYSQLHYLYMRSFYPDIKKSKETEKVTDYYLTQIEKYWLKRSLYAKGLMVLISHRNDNSKMTDKIIKSLKETSITSDELGMYWKDNTNSLYWHQAPIETQALMIEVFSEVAPDTETIDLLKIWLLKNKQTNSWKTTKATTEAVYALLLQGSDWLSVTDTVDLTIGGESIAEEKLDEVKSEAGTGYFKTSWTANEITPNMSEVTITKNDKGIAWGSLYWQYFEDLDKITPAESPFQLKKQLFKRTYSDTGELLTPINENSTLKVGDLVRVRIELRSDRAMEFLHMKDMRASGLEPLNVLSQYKWQDGLGYYESTKDVATHFFFDYLPKGVFVFEYDLRVNNEGEFSNGITTIQSMYAPEFSSHSEGIRITTIGNN